MSNTPARVQKINELVAQIGAKAERAVKLYRHNRVSNPSFEPIVLTASPTVLPHNVLPSDLSSEGYTYYAVSPAEKPDSRNYITMFGIAPFPGSCALVVSTNSIVHPDYWKRGINKLGIQLRQELAIYTGYTAIICTDIQGHAASIRTIEGANFTKFHELVNKRTRNRINLYFKMLED